MMSAASGWLVVLRKDTNELGFAASSPYRCRSSVDDIEKTVSPARRSRFPSSLSPRLASSSRIGPSRWVRFNTSSWLGEKFQELPPPCSLSGCPAVTDIIRKAKASAGVAGEVYQILTRSPGVFPNMEDVAQAMRMTSRTLRRRLNEEDVSFSAIVDDFHRAVAIEYITKTKLSYDDIAILIGFTDIANFRRVLKIWTGKNPSEIRG